MGGGMPEPPRRILVVCPTARDRAHLNRLEIRRAYDVECRGTDEETHAPGFDAVRFLHETIRAIERRRDRYRAVGGFDDFPACGVGGPGAEPFAPRAGRPPPPAGAGPGGTAPPPPPPPITTLFDGLVAASHLDPRLRT